ncbi:MAG TPA: 6-pyruvoyl-tetrahydropterin synthase-related protein [Candidatus Norongarragalinales archaeon]|nr:6-pyruvoyl-tetrahydropterin synthase-related protein [Candidatus Norongarragalinales archaeon]
MKAFPVLTGGKTAYLVLAVAAIAASLPVLTADPAPRGLDLFIHLYHIDYARLSFASGHLFPEWDSLTGYGNPVFYVYGPLSFLLAGLTALVVGTIVAYKFWFLLWVFISGVAMYWLAKNFTSDELAAVVAALVYMVAPWHWIDVAFRASFAQGPAYAIAPLVLIAVDRAWSALQKGNKKHALGLSLLAGAGIAFITLSHVYSGALVGFVAAFWLFASAAWLASNEKQRRSEYLRGAGKIVIIAGVAALLLSFAWIASSLLFYGPIVSESGKDFTTVNFFDRAYNPLAFFDPLASVVRVQSLEARFGDVISERLGFLGALQPLALSYLGKYGSVDVNPYVGVALMLASLPALAFLRREIGRDERISSTVFAFASLFVVAVLLAANRFLFVDLSIINSLVQVSTRWLFVVTLALCPLIAIGIAEARKWSARATSNAGKFLWIVLVALLFVDVAPGLLLVNAGGSTQPFLEAQPYFEQAYGFVQQQPGLFAIAEYYQNWQQARWFYVSQHGKRSIGFPNFLLDFFLSHPDPLATDASLQLADYGVKYIFVRDGKVVDEASSGLSSVASLEEIKDPALKEVFRAGDLVVLENTKWKGFVFSKSSQCTVLLDRFDRAGRYEMRADCKYSDVIAVQEMPLPGWRASIDGQPVTLEVHQTWFGVPVTQGFHTVVVERSAPNEAWIALLISFLALVGTAWLLVKNLE